MKTMMITGASDGVGRATALALARQGHRLIVHGRDAAKLATLERELRAAGAAGATALTADFADPAAVARLAAEARVAAGGRLDVLVNNAGAMFPDRRELWGGREATVAVNHLAPAALTFALLDLLRAAAPARIVMLSSTAHRAARPNLADLDQARGWSMMRAYADSKLCNLLFAQELARRLDPAAVTVNAVHPGGVRTELARDLRGGWKALFAAAMPLLFIAPNKGARTSVFAATDPSLAGVTGRYFANSREERPAAVGRDETLRAAIWRWTLGEMDRQGFATPPAMR